LEIRRRDLFTRPRRHRTGPFVWPCSLPTQQQEHPMPPQQTNITSEGDAAGLDLELPIALARESRSALGLLKRYWRAFQERRQYQSLRAGLAYLSDRELMDIGLTRDEIDY